MLLAAAAACPRYTKQTSPKTRVKRAPFCCLSPRPRLRELSGGARRCPERCRRRPTGWAGGVPRSAELTACAQSSKRMTRVTQLAARAAAAAARQAEERCSSCTAPSSEARRSRRLARGAWRPRWCGSAEHRSGRQEALAGKRKGRRGQLLCGLRHRARSGRRARSFGSCAGRQRAGSGSSASSFGQH